MAEVRLIDSSDQIVYEMECSHCAEQFPWRVRSPQDDKFFPKYCPNCGKHFVDEYIDVQEPPDSGAF